MLELQAHRLVRCLAALARAVDRWSDGFSLDIIGPTADNRRERPIIGHQVHTRGIVATSATIVQIIRILRLQAPRRTEIDH